MSSPDNNNDDHYVYDVVHDLLKSLKDGQHNDVRITVTDGHIDASKAILAARSVYFAKMFDSEHQFNEASGSVNIKSNKKIVMKVLSFLYAGDFSYKNLDLFEFMEVMDLLRMMMLDGASDLAYDKFIKALDKQTFPLKDCLAAIKISLDQELNIDQDLIYHIYDNLPEIFNAECQHVISEMTRREFDLLMFYNGHSMKDELMR